MASGQATDSTIYASSPKCDWGGVGRFSREEPVVDKVASPLYLVCDSDSWPRPLPSEKGPRP